MKVEVSVGEAIDKLCILELKIKKIKDEKKRIEISKEIDALSQCNEFKKEYDFYYNLLMYVNEKIWDMTDSIKGNSVYDETFAFISNQIFEFNQKRFRVKNWFNLLTDSNIKEQKSYFQTHCKILISNEEEVFSKLPEIHYLALEYDVITFDGLLSKTDGPAFDSLISTMKKILKVPTIIYDEEEIKLLSRPKIILLAEFEIPKDESSGFFVR